MSRFFIKEDNIKEGMISVTGADALHIAESLRMKPGENITFCDGDNTEYLCRIEKSSPEQVLSVILEKRSSGSEPSVKVTLYTAVSKADKMKFIIQKAVEIGVFSVVPFLSERCVSRPDGESLDKKNERWQKIAEEASKQSGRGIIPRIGKILKLSDVIKDADKFDLPLLLYEGETNLSLKRVLTNTEKWSTVAIVTGPEGGFEKGEVNLAVDKGFISVSLGPRILRCETAPIAALCSVIYQSDNF